MREYAESDQTGSMIEIRFHGRGGQGTVVASILLAKAFFEAGYHVQSFPVFGVERRGAPVEAFLRLATEKIVIRSSVYTPDHVVVQDLKLLDAVDVTKGLKEGGWMLLNTSDVPPCPERFARYRMAFVDATGIAVDNRLGTRTHPIINTAMIGAFARVMEMPPFELIAGAIEKEIAIYPDRNILAARDAYDSVRFDGCV